MIVACGNDQGGQAQQLNSRYGLYIGDVENDRIQLWLPGAVTGITVVGRQVSVQILHKWMVLKISMSIQRLHYLSQIQVINDYKNTIDLLVQSLALLLYLIYHLVVEICLLNPLPIHFTSQVCTIIVRFVCHQQQWLPEEMDSDRSLIN